MWSLFSSVCQGDQNRQDVLHEDIVCPFLTPRIIAITTTTFWRKTMGWMRASKLKPNLNKTEEQICLKTEVSPGPVGGCSPLEKASSQLGEVTKSWPTAIAPGFRCDMRCLLSVVADTPSYGHSICFLAQFEVLVLTSKWPGLQLRYLTSTTIWSFKLEMLGIKTGNFCTLYHLATTPSFLSRDPKATNSSGSLRPGKRACIITTSSPIKERNSYYNTVTGILVTCSTT